MARLWLPPISSIAGRLAAILLLCLGAAAAVAQDGAHDRTQDRAKTPPRRASAALEETFNFVKKEVKPPTDAPNTVVLAAQGTPEGHWRFVNQTGEMFTAGTADEMKRVVTVLYPEAKAGAPLAIYLTEDTVLGPSSRLRALPPRASKHIVVDGKSYRLLPLVGGPPYVGVRPHVAIEVRDTQRLKEILARLDKPLAKARVRLLALEPDGPNEKLPQEPPAVVGETVPVERIDPAHLASAVAALDGQTLVVCARGAGDLIYVKPAKASEPERLPVGHLMAAVDNADVALIVLQFAATQQRPAEAPCPNGSRPASELALGDILEAAAAGSSQTPVAVALGGGLKALDAVVVGAPVTGAIRLEDAHRRSVGWSLIGDVPLPAPALYIALDVALTLLLLGWLGTPAALRFWGKAGDGAATTKSLLRRLLGPRGDAPTKIVSLWSAGQEEDYASLTGYRAARVVSFLVFALVFQPLTGVFTALYNLLPQIWRTIVVLVRPIVWLARAWDAFARRSAGSK